MGLFKKKETKSKVDQALELMNSFTDEELEEFMTKADLDGDGDVDEKDVEESDGKEETDMTEDEKQIAEAKKDIEEKGKDTQTEKDRIDESVGEQERADGDEDSQSAKDRVDESEGAEKADDERHEASQEDRLDRIERAVLSIVEMLKPSKAEEKAVEETAKEIYGLGNGVFSDTKGTNDQKQVTKEDVARTINKIMR